MWERQGLTLPHLSFSAEEDTGIFPPLNLRNFRIVYLNESVSNLISMLGEMRSYNILYTASRMGMFTW